MYCIDLTDEQWTLIAPLITQPQPRSDRRGRPRHDNRAVLNGILWVLRTGAPWKDLPERYPSYQTCHRRFQEWKQTGVLERILEALARDLQERGDLDLQQCFNTPPSVEPRMGAALQSRPGKNQAPASWRLQTALLLLSPSTLSLLYHMKSPLLRRFAPGVASH